MYVQIPDTIIIQNNDVFVAFNTHMQIVDKKLNIIQYSIRMKIELIYNCILLRRLRLSL